MKKLFFLLFVLASCKASEESVVGTYVRHWDFENNSKLTLYEDKTFDFRMQEGLMFYKFKGNWALENKHILLNSISDKENYPNSLIKKKQFKINRPLTLKIEDKESVLPGASVSVYSSGKLFTDFPRESGLVEFQLEKYDSILVEYPGLKPIKIVGTENYFELQLNAAEPITIDLQKVRWRKVGRKLYDPKYKEDKNSNVYKKSSS